MTLDIEGRNPGADERDEEGLTARQRSWADSISLDAMAIPAALEPGPLVTLRDSLKSMTDGSEGQTSLAEEAEEQATVAAYAICAEARDEAQCLHSGLAAVGQLPALEVGPEPLGRVQLRCVAGQPPHFEPVLLLGQEHLHRPAPMRGQPVP